MNLPTVFSGTITIRAASHYVSAAFWSGVLAGVVAACLCVVFAHQWLGLEYGFPGVDMDRRPSYTNALGQQVHSNLKFDGRWPSNFVRRYRRIAIRLANPPFRIA
jgi:hypothetical protein